LLYSPRWLFLYPGAALFLLGTAGCLWLLPGTRTVQGISFDVHSLLFAATAVLVGFEAINFAAFTKICAVTEGLLPEDPRLNRLFRYITLEVGLSIGALLLVAGASLCAASLSYWGTRHFGVLDPSKTFRLVIPGVLCVTLGFQIIFSSFFLSVLGMARR
jgi:hypothetical protein